MLTQVYPFVGNEGIPFAYEELKLVSLKSPITPGYRVKERK